MSPDKAKATPPVRSDSSVASDKAGTLKPRSDKPRAMGRIEHTLLDEGRKSSPTDLRPSPATPPYHTKCQMFLSTTKGRGLVPFGYSDPKTRACTRGEGRVGRSEKHPKA